MSSPNDPEFKKQWALNNSAQSIVIDAEDGDVQVGLKSVDMRLLKAWDTTQGSSNVIVAIIEQFDADLGHPDLVNSRWINTGEIPGNGIDDDHNGFRDDVFGYDFTDDEADVSDDLDESGHATHISGIVGARKGNALGISGVAPGVRVMHLRAAANNPPAINAAIDYAKNNGARIVNLSQGGGPLYNIRGGARQDRRHVEPAVRLLGGQQRGQQLQLSVVVPRREHPRRSPAPTTWATWGGAATSASSTSTSRRRASASSARFPATPTTGRTGRRKRPPTSAAWPPCC